MRVELRECLTNEKIIMKENYDWKKSPHMQFIEQFPVISKTKAVGRPPNMKLWFTSNWNLFSPA